MEVIKASPLVRVKVEVSGIEGNRQVILRATVSKLGYVETPTGTIKFVNTRSGSAIEITESTKIEIIEGRASYELTELVDGIYKVKAAYSGDNNYNTTSSNESNFDTSKKDQKNFKIDNIGSKNYGDSSFTLLTTGGNGIGAVTFESSNSDILSIDGNRAIFTRREILILQL